MPDILTVSGEELIYASIEGRTSNYPASMLDQMCEEKFTPPLNGEAIPDGVKFIQWQSPHLIVVHESKPIVRNLKWIANESLAPYGYKARYRYVRIALPYTVTVITMRKEGQQSFFKQCAVELYFRNSPLTSFYDLLGIPTIHNVRAIDEHYYIGNPCLVCCQHLESKVDFSWSSLTEGIIEHIWNSGFNRAYEMDTYDVCRNVRLKPIENWEQNTIENEKFILEQQWRTQYGTLGQRIENFFLNFEKRRMSLPSLFHNYMLSQRYQWQTS